MNTTRRDACPYRYRYLTLALLVASTFGTCGASCQGKSFSPVTRASRSSMRSGCVSRISCRAITVEFCARPAGVSGSRVPVVDEAECVGCNLCQIVCPVEGCIDMVQMRPGEVDPRTGRTVEPDYANWTTHPNNPMARAAE